MKRRRAGRGILVPVLLLLLSGFLHPETSTRKKWQLELSVGSKGHAPDDFNLLVPHDEWQTHFMNYYYGDHYGFGLVATGETNGKLQALGGYLPYTVRLRFSLNRTFSLSLGLGYFDNHRESTFGEAYDFENRDPEYVDFAGRFSTRFEYTDYRLGMKGFFPHMGLQAGLPLWGRLRAAGFVEAGLMLVSCSYASVLRHVDGLWDRDRTYETAMNGKGRGFVLDLGLKLEYLLGSHFGIFVEGLHRFGRVGQMTGRFTQTLTYQDGEAQEVERLVEAEREGTWVLRRTWLPYLKYWYTPNILSPGETTAREPFVLDFNGFHLQLGLSFRL